MPKTLPPIEITVSVSGKIPRRSYENFSPMLSIKEFLLANTNDTDRLKRQKALQLQLEGLFNQTRDSIKLEELQETFKNLRFTLNPADGKKYPHVTDILYWSSEFYISADELTQYGARGSAVHSMIDHWIATKEWSDKVIRKSDIILLKHGSLRLFDTLDSINFMGFMEKFGADFEFGGGEKQGFNKDHFYCGTYDREGLYQKRPAIVDWKCRAAKDDDFKQMAMYLHLDDPKMQFVRENKGVMVIVPLNSDNKSGYGKPAVSDEIEKYFNLALRERDDYKKKFGI